MEQKRIKRTVELFCSSFHPQANQTLIVLSNPAVIVTLCFTKDYATMCSVCQMMTKAWSVIYARVICFFVFLISLMISPYINFNKFLRICWCTLILARGWGCIISAQKKKKKKSCINKTILYTKLSQPFLHCANGRNMLQCALLHSSRSQSKCVLPLYYSTLSLRPLAVIHGAKVMLPH